MPTLQAIVTSHSTRHPGYGSGYTATFYYSEGGPQMRQFPHIEIPCDSYEHARAVVDAFNKVADYCLTPATVA